VQASAQPVHRENVTGAAPFRRLSCQALKVMMNARALIVAYIILVPSLAVIWAGLHKLPKWLLLSTFAIGSVAGGVTMIYLWLKFRTKSKRLLRAGREL